MCRGWRLTFTRCKTDDKYGCYKKYKRGAASNQSNLFVNDCTLWSYTDPIRRGEGRVCHHQKRRIPSSVPSRAARRSMADWLKVLYRLRITVPAKESSATSMTDASVVLRDR